MAKKKKAFKKPNTNKPTMSQPLPGRGFDLGDRPTIMVIPDIEFIQALGQADIVGIAYGFEKVQPGFPGRLPLLSLIVSNPEPIQKVFEHFSRWGVEEDGDVVEIEIFLKNDGSYCVAIFPNSDRAVFRLAAGQELSKPIVTIAMYLKTFDTTNPMMQDLMEYRSASLSPVSISAMELDESKPMSPESLKEIPNIKSFIKYCLKIENERDNPNHFLNSVGKNSNKKPPKNPSSNVSPRECGQLRREAIDTAFPITRERIRKSSIISLIQNSHGFNNVTKSQIEQAVINLILSTELAEGCVYFQKLVADDFKKHIWDYIDGRLERADGQNIVDKFTIEEIKTQIKLDIIEILGRRHLPDNMDINALQAMFLRKGFGHE